MNEPPLEEVERPSRRPPPLERPSLPPEAREASSPHFEPNRILRWLWSRFFRHMRVDDRWSGVVREAASKGVVLYVMRTISVLDFLCLDYLVKRFRLPLVRFVNDLGLWILEPFGRGERRLRLRRQIPEAEALSSIVAQGESALLFLRRGPTLGEPAKERGLEVDLIATLVAQQRKLERPILLVPQTFVWTKQPPNKKRSLIDLVFGPSEWPGRIRVLVRFLLNYRNAELRSGEPFDLRLFLEEHQDLTDTEAADAIRYALLRRMERERQIVIGPRKKTAGRIREELLRSPRLKPHLEAAAKEKGKSLEAVQKDADKELRRLCAMMDPNAIGLFERILDWVFSRIYDGLSVDQEGIERLREAARRGPLILLPSHKSHVDYLALSYALVKGSLSPPLIAAGDNLAFFPAGPLLRRAGAFFIRRSFRGRKLYAALVDAYLRKILVEGFNLEFFLEGGRSRTGKLLPPKLGLLSMVVDAGLKLPQLDVSFVPISVGYERVIEERAYARELGGGEKEPESVGGLLRSSRVLRSKYGRLYIQFGEILPFRELLEEATRLSKLEGSNLTPPERRALVQRIAHRVTYEIDRVTVVTPAALVASALLGAPGGESTHEALLERAAELLAALERAEARIATPILRQDAELLRPRGRDARADTARDLMREEAIVETLALLADAKLLEVTGSERERRYRIPDNRRIGLEYHKNAILHFFVPRALISTALRLDGDGSSIEAIRERVQGLSRLFKYEFMFRADASFDAIFDDALASMQEAEEIEVDGEDSVRAVDGALVPAYAAMLRTYFESYWLAARSLATLEGKTRKKDWLKETLSLGRKLASEGEIDLRESISKPKLESALGAFHDLGLVRASGDHLEPGAALADDEALGVFVRRIEKYLEPTAL